MRFFLDNARYLGFAFCLSVNLVCFQSTMLYVPGPDALQYATLFLFMSLLMTVITRFLAAAIVARYPNAVHPVIAAAAAVLEAAGILAALLASFVFTSETTEYLYLIGAALVGIGSAWLDVLWLQIFGTMRPERSSVLLAFNVVLSGVLFLVFGEFTRLLSTVTPFAFIAFPLVSGALLAYNVKNSDSPAPKDVMASYFQAIKTIWATIAAAIIFQLIGSTVSFIISSDASSFQDAQIVVQLVSTAFALVFFIFLMTGKRKFDMTKMYRVIVPVLFLGCLLLPLVWSSNTTFASALMMSGSVMFDLIVMCLVTEAAYDYQASGAVLGGVARGLTIGASGVASLFGFYLRSNVEFGTAEVVVLMLIALYLLGTAVFLLTGKHKYVINDLMDSAQSNLGSMNVASMEDAFAENIQALVTPDSPAEIQEAGISTDNRLEQIAEKYQLSRRKREIFMYIAKGRSAVWVADLLVVSENTIRSHMRRMYEKLGVHSKQELLDLVEQELSAE